MPSRSKFTQYEAPLPLFEIAGRNHGVRACTPFRIKKKKTFLSPGTAICLSVLKAGMRSVNYCVTCLRIDCVARFTPWTIPLNVGGVGTFPLAVLHTYVK